MPSERGNHSRATQVINGSSYCEESMDMLPFMFCTLAFMACAVQAQPAITAVSYPARVLENQTCPSEDQRQVIDSQIDSELRTIISQLNPCGDPGWTRVAFLNMTNASQNCPSGWLLDRDAALRTCRKTFPNRRGCSSVVYETGGSNYSEVCGRVIGYQHGLTQAFLGSTVSIDSPYVDGISVTHGEPKQHIWTFAAGGAETNYLNYSCPCVDGSTNGPNIPAFVGENYFCEAGVRTVLDESQFYSDDPLWDGQGCGSTSNCCTFNSPPWFRMQLPSVASDAIEVRICHEIFREPERAVVELLELYIR